MNEAIVIFMAAFLCGLTLKLGEAFGELICYIVKQSFGLHKEKKELKNMQSKHINDLTDERMEAEIKLKNMQIERLRSNCAQQHVPPDAAY